MDGQTSRTYRVCVVGSGTRFLSGISIYTVRLANALADRHRVSMVTMRRLLPARLYPGRLRVGAQLTDLDRHPRVQVSDGIDWYWGLSMIRAVLFLRRRRPDFIVLQWWTGTVLHSYLALTLLARLLGSRVIIEFHEIIETGEDRIPLARRYIQVLAPLLMRLAHAFAVHSAFDGALVRERFPLRGRPITVLPHGPHDHYKGEEGESEPIRDAPEATTNLLFFGVIRPYKGLEHLVAAFDLLEQDEINDYWLTVVGETWEGWTLPTEKIAASRYKERITFINRYVHDQELDRLLAGADAVVLPYLRSSLSGPLHVAMGYGLPIIMTDVGGNAEAATGYEGIVLVAPSDALAIRDAIRRVSEMRGGDFSHPTSWAQTAEAYEALFGILDASGTAP